MYGHNGFGLQTRGAVVESWDRFDPYHLMGVKPAAAMATGGGLGGGLQHSAGPALVEGDDRPWHPDSPMFWFGALLAVTFGLIGASTAIRVGPFKAALSAGKQ